MQRVYLAGPEVFWPDASAILRAKSEITRGFGFEPAPPGDVQVPPGPGPHARGLRGPDGLRLEDHGMHDNLMIDTTVLADGGTLVAMDGGPRDLAAFRACLAAARAWWDAR